MYRLDERDTLIVAIAARMIVGPGDVFRILIVARVPRFVRVLMFAVKEVCAPDAAERAERRPQILVIARRQNPAASLPEARDALTVGQTQSVAQVYGEEPEFVEVGRIELT